MGQFCIVYSRFLRKLYNTNTQPLRNLVNQSSVVHMYASLNNIIKLRFTEGSQSETASVFPTLIAHTLLRISTYPIAALPVDEEVKFVNFHQAVSFI